MNSILLLTKLQLQESIGGARAAIEKRTGANGAMAGTVLIGVLLLGGIGWLGYSAYGLVGQMGLAKALYNVLFLGCGTLTFMFSLPSILGTFFGSSDTNDLLSLPVSPFAIVFSKALGALATALRSSAALRTSLPSSQGLCFAPSCFSRPSPLRATSWRQRDSHARAPTGCT